jgi:hypothetical protein
MSTAPGPLPRPGLIDLVPEAWRGLVYAAIGLAGYLFGHSDLAPGPAPAPAPCPCGPGHQAPAIPHLQPNGELPE